MYKKKYIYINTYVYIVIRVYHVNISIEYRASNDFAFVACEEPRKVGDALSSKCGKIWHSRSISRGGERSATKRKFSNLALREGATWSTISEISNEFRRENAVSPCLVTIRVLRKVQSSITDSDYTDGIAIVR